MVFVGQFGLDHFARLCGHTLIFTVPDITWTKACFEAMSAGSTALSANGWRCFLQIIGGLGVVLLVVTVLLLLSGMDVSTAFAAAVAAIKNNSPSPGEVGPAGNFGGLSSFYLRIWMLLTVLVLFTTQFWRK